MFSSEHTSLPLYQNNENFLFDLQCQLIVHAVHIRIKNVPVTNILEFRCIQEKFVTNTVNETLNLFIKHQSLCSKVYSSEMRPKNSFLDYR